MTQQSRNWCFTLNNYSDEEVAVIDAIFQDGVSYVTYGKEVGENGTPHLQGFIIFDRKKRFTAVKLVLGNRVHLEPARGPAYRAAVYCHKDGDFKEFGTRPSCARGNGHQFADYVRWINEFYDEFHRRPTEREIANAYPALFVRYSRALNELTNHLVPYPDIQEGELRDWQIELERQLSEEPNDRTVNFVYDPAGGKGKSFFMRWYFSKHGDKTQLLSAGKRDDIAHSIDPYKTVFLFNIPRGGMEFLQYTILEQLKDRVVFSPKYNSTTKILSNKCHVVVFCNEFPNLDKMTADRYNLINI